MEIVQYLVESLMIYDVTQTGYIAAMYKCPISFV